MRFIVSVVLLIGLAFVGWTAHQAGSLLNLAGASITPANGQTAPVQAAYTVEADWRFVDRVDITPAGFRGHIDFRPASAAAEDTPASRFALDYPAAFNGALSIHRMGQKANARELYESRQASGLEHLNCLSLTSSQTLVKDTTLRTMVRDYYACPAQSVGEGPKIQAVIGIIPTSRSHQPLDRTTERCAAEAAIWLDHVAHPETQHAICMILIDEASQQGDVVVFERQGDKMIVLSAKHANAKDVVTVRSTKTRPSTNIERYQHFQSWKLDTENVQPAFYEHLPALGQKIAERGAALDTNTYFKLEDVSVLENAIRIHLRSISDGRLGGREKRGPKIRDAVFKLLCSDPQLAAFLDLQQLDTVLGVRLKSEDGAVMLDGRHDETPCNLRRQ